MEDTNIETLILASFAAEEAVKTAQVEYENSLHAVVAAKGNSTFQHNDQWFQVRTRTPKDAEGKAVTYLCSLKAEPKTWLKGRPRKVTETSSDEVTAMIQQALDTPETDGEAVSTTTVIE